MDGFLKLLMQSFDDAPVNFYLYDAISHSAPWTIQLNSDPAYAASFVSHYAELNPYQTLNLLARPTGAVYLATDATPAGDVKRSAFYNEWMRPQGIAADHPSVNLFNDGQQCVAMALAPLHWAEPALRNVYREKLDKIIPHMVRALEIHRRLGLLGNMHQALTVEAHRRC